jgi:hypothetical protein
MTEYTVVLARTKVPRTDSYSSSTTWCVSQGIGKKGALRTVREAMELWLEGSLEDGYEPIEETSDLIAKELAFVLDWKATKAGRSWWRRLESLARSQSLLEPAEQRRWAASDARG